MLSINGGTNPGHVVAPDGTRYPYFSPTKVIQLSADGLSIVGQSKMAHEDWQYPKEWETEGFWPESPN